MLDPNFHIATVEIFHLAGAHMGGTDRQSRPAPVDQGKVHEFEQVLFQGHCRIITGSIRSQWKMRSECRERIRLEEARKAAGQDSQVRQRPSCLGPDRPGIPERFVGHPPPELLKSGQTIVRLVSGNQARVDRPDRGTDDPVGLDARLVQCLIDTSLISTERATPLQDQNDLAWPRWLVWNLAFRHRSSRLDSSVRIHCAVHPPSTGRAAPVIEAAASVQRKTDSAPICSVVTNCRVGWAWRRTSRTTSSSLI